MWLKRLLGWMERGRHGHDHGGHDHHHGGGHHHHELDSIREQFETLKHKEQQHMALGQEIIDRQALLHTSIVNLIAAGGAAGTGGVTAAEGEQILANIQADIDLIANPAELIQKNLTEPDRQALVAAGLNPGNMSAEEFQKHALPVLRGGGRRHGRGPDSQGRYPGQPGYSGTEDPRYSGVDSQGRYPGQPGYTGPANPRNTGADAQGRLPGDPGYVGPDNQGGPPNYARGTNLNAQDEADLRARGLDASRMSQGELDRLRAAGRNPSRPFQQ